MDFYRLKNLSKYLRTHFIIGFLAVVAHPLFSQSFEGSYTIGSIGADYSSITSAVTALEAGTITGNVTFIIQAGTYVETIDLSGLNNGDFTITFSGEDKESVILQPNGTIDGAGILIDGTNNLILENFTLQTDDIAADAVDAFTSDTQGIAIKNADNIQLSNIAETNTGTLNGSTAEIGVVVLIQGSSNVVIEGCNFSGVVGSHFWMDDFNAVSIENGSFSNHTNTNIYVFTTSGTDLEVKNSDFYVDELSVYALEISSTSTEDTYGFSFEGNTFHAVEGFGEIINISDLGSVSFINNEIPGLISLLGCDTVKLESNYIHDSYNVLAITGLVDGFIYNNIFHSSNNSAIYIDADAGGKLMFIHNTVYNGAYASVSDFSEIAAGTFANNIFVSKGASTPAFKFASLAVDFSQLAFDHNLYYAESGIAVQYPQPWPGGVNEDFPLSEWQTESGQESNSQFFEPTFASADDLHIASATQLRFGTYIDTLTTDIDGDLRTASGVDVGADQFYGELFETMTGSYTIGTVSGTADFETIEEAVNTLKSAEVTGDITFTLEAETFSETVDLSSLPNGDFTVTLSGEDKETSIIRPDGNIDGAGILIDWTSNITLENFTLEMDDISAGQVGAKSNITRGISISSSSNISIVNLSLSNNSEVFDLESPTHFIATSISMIDVEEITVTDCSFNMAGVHNWIDDFTNVTIENNSYTNGQYHVYNKQSSGSSGNGLMIDNNVMTGPMEGAIDVIGYNEAQKVEGVTIQYNTIDGVEHADRVFFNAPQDRYNGIDLSKTTGAIVHHNIVDTRFGMGTYANESLTVHSNQFLSSEEAFGTYVGEENTGSVIYNNFFYGYVSIYDPVTLTFVQNSVSESDNTRTFSLDDPTGADNTVINNIFAGYGEVATLFYLSLDGGGLALDNNLYSIENDDPDAVPVVIEYSGSGSFTSLGDWQTFQTEFDQSSQSFQPSFVSASDFHITNVSDYRFGTYVDTFNADIDGDLRSEPNVDVGADQYLCESSVGEETVEVCESYEWEGTTHTVSGTYVEILANVAGCDSTATLNLTILEETSGSDEVTTCESYDWEGTTYTSSGTYTEVLTNVAGCDSTATLNLTILEETSGSEAVTTCGSYDWEGTTYTVSGTYTEVLTNVAGCDSTATLNLTILEETSGSDEVTTCGSYDWNGTTYTTSGSYIEVLTNVAGCDSTATLNLTILEETAGSDEVITCGSYEWEGTTYTSSGTYTEVLTNIAGCDSTATLNLTILEETSGSDEVITCKSYDWEGTTYTVSGSYTEVLTNVAGCDSTATLNLTILEETAGSDEVTTCGSYDWQGTTYTVSGTYTEFLTNVAGCDSTATLNLTILEETSGSEEVTTCGSYDWEGTTYTVSGSYTEVLTNAAGCDSTAILNLTILQTDNESVVREACGSYEFGSQILTEAGVYTETFLNAHGCDSIITLDLVLHAEPTGAVQVNDGSLFALDGDDHTYQWYDCATNEALEGATGQRLVLPFSGSFYVEVSNGACTSISECHDVATIPLSVNRDEIAISAYPNPTADGVIFLKGVEPNSTYKLYNATGQQVQEGALNSNQIYIEGNQGLYYLQIIRLNEVHNQKIFKIGSK